MTRAKAAMMLEGPDLALCDDARAIKAKTGNTPSELADACEEWRKLYRDQGRQRQNLLDALAQVRQELWVDHCLHKGRTDCDPREFASKPHIRIIDDAVAKAQS